MVTFFLFIGGIKYVPEIFKIPIYIIEKIPYIEFKCQLHCNNIIVNRASYQFNLIMIKHY